MPRNRTLLIIIGTAATTTLAVLRAGLLAGLIVGAAVGYAAARDLERDHLLDAYNAGWIDGLRVEETHRG
jgi:hypothetical protein